MIKTMILHRENIYRGNLLLVNADYPYHCKQANNLISADARFSDILLKREAANLLQLTLEKISANDSIVPVSGYRSVEEQIAIYEDSLKNNGADFTKKYVALPHHSEHHTGLAIDLGLKKDSIDFICPEFPYEGICDEFRKAAPEYGFIERYGKGKEQITGISHEPWHFRYVGFPHSKIMYEHGYSLEEYTLFIMSFRDHCRYIRKLAYMEVEIYYVPAEADETSIILDSDWMHQISGNNISGFVITAWRNINEQKK